jgi:hypothetical protein
MRETLFLLFDKGVNDGHLGRRFPLLWRRIPRNSRAFISVAKEITQKFADDPRRGNLEYVTTEHGLERGSDESEAAFTRLKFQTDSYETAHRTIVEPHRYLPRHDTQWLFLYYERVPAFPEYGEWQGRRFPLKWHVSASREDHETFKADFVGDFLNTRENSVTGWDKVDFGNVVVVESRNGFAAAQDVREIGWADLVKAAREIAPRITGVARDCLGRYELGKAHAK